MIDCLTNGDGWKLFWVSLLKQCFKETMILEFGLRVLESVLTMRLKGNSSSQYIWNTVENFLRVRGVKIPQKETDPIIPWRCINRIV